MARADKSARINAAVDAIRRGDFTTYSAATDFHNVDRTAVSRRMRGLTKTRKDATAFYHQALSTIEEELLISHINKLTDRGMPPTSQIVKNLAEEIRGAEVGKNWVAHFCKRHQLRLKSAYLRNIENLRTSAEYAPMFVLFFTMVLFYFKYFWYSIIEIIDFWLMRGNIFGYD